MSDEIKIIVPEIFPQNQIIAGVTQRMQEIYPPYGFSILANKHTSVDEAIANRRKLANFFNAEYQNFVFQKQIHSDLVTKINDNKSEKTSDGMITNLRGIFLCIKIADCCAVLCYDPKSKAIGAFHCGWRGAYNKILIKGIEMMKREYSSNPEDMFFYLSPCASQCCYEVGNEFCSYFSDTVIKRGDKYYFDLKSELKNQLISIGANENKIELSPHCTICNSIFHSFRRDKEDSGRMAAFICLR